MLVTVLVGTITGYSDSCGVPPWGITSNGERTQLGICACSEHWSFGTIFVIEDLGTFVCQDRGGLVQEKGQIDIWFPTYQLAIEHGIWTRWVKVYRELVIPRGFREE